MLEESQGLATEASAVVSHGVSRKVKEVDGQMTMVSQGELASFISENAVHLNSVDPRFIAAKSINGAFDGISRKDFDFLSIQYCADLTSIEPEYSKLAATLLTNVIENEVLSCDINSFSEYIELGHQLGLINDRLHKQIKADPQFYNELIDKSRNTLFEYFGCRTVYDRYLLRHPEERLVIETIQYFFLRVASALGKDKQNIIDLYDTFSALDYLPSSPTLFNAGTTHEQLSSCYLLDSPKDDLSQIYRKYEDIALLSKFAGGIGLAYHRIRSRGSLIRSTNGYSNGVIPFLKTLDSSVAAVNQGGRRKGACCVYLESWHADIEDFLELRENTGDESRRTHNLNLANWIPDLFMQRLEQNGDWSLFDPKAVPHLVDLFGSEFVTAYEQAEREGKAVKTVKARDLYGKMMKTLAQTGNGWITFKDSSNLKCNQTLKPENVVHLSNLCTEILEVNNENETSVCNLGSINLGRHASTDEFDFDKLGKTVRRAIRQLDSVIDINFYPIASAKNSNSKWRPVGLGVMGLQDVFFKLRYNFDSAEALELSRDIAEEIYFHAMSESCEIAKEEGAHPGFEDTRLSKGEFQFDLWGIEPKSTDRWADLRKEILKYGVRNSLVIAIAPTATIASISGCYECIEPQTSNLFKKETLSGEFLQINRYLVSELKECGLWTEDIRDKIKMSEGSIQNIEEIPADLKMRYRTTWEIPMKALIELAAARGPYIDQSQSLNLFMENPNIGSLSSMYFYAWKKGLKTTYYLRSRPATKINKATIGNKKKEYTPEEAVACSLENPEVCEACQ